MTATCCLSKSFSVADVVLNRPVPKLEFGAKFRAELDRSMSASWSNVSLRSIFRRISDQRKVAILLDRRIDPTPELEIDIANLSLLAAIEHIATQSSAAVSVVGNTLYVAPPARAARLRTLVELQSIELFKESSTLSKRRYFNLVNRQMFHWNDLDQPSELLRRIAKTYKLEIHGLDLIPHDLWAGATLPKVNAIEALSLVLIQFDRTFTWTKRMRGIRVVPIPAKIAIEKKYVPRGTTSVAAVRKWTAAIRGLQAEPKGGVVVVRGTVEQHEILSDLLRPREKRKKSVGSAGPTPLHRRTFTYRTRNVPIRAIMRELEKKSGMVFTFDHNALASAGIDLDKKISIELRNASAEKLLEEIFGRLGLTFSIDNLTVTLLLK